MRNQPTFVNCPYIETDGLVIRIPIEKFCLLVQLAVLLILCMVYYEIMSTVAQKSFNVVNYGAVGDSKTNDAKAFYKAWNDTCNYASGVPSMIIPGGKTFFVGPLTFKGPCKANNVNVKIYGNIIAPKTPLAWKGIDSSRWLAFHGISGLKVNGTGQINGRGSSVGSLGKGSHGPTKAHVEHIAVEFAQFENTTNGARIKTWQGGSGYARHISFKQLKFTNVKNPIIIDQSYCTVRGACKAEGQLAVLLILCMVYYEIMSTAAQKSFSVVNHGAVGDGNTDDAKIYGSIIAPNTPLAWKGIDSSQWLAFNGISGLTVSGPGLIDGRGSSWWSQSCRCHPKPALKFIGCKRLNLNNMHMRNSPQTHIFILRCSEVLINTVVIRAPQESPNTDGIHVQSSQNVSISKSNISNGDDFISIGDFISNLKIKYAYCCFDDGISVESLGRGPHGGTEAHVDYIAVELAQFESTTNGERIKTWELKFTNVKNPIIIVKPTGVQISDVTYSGITGTSITQAVMNFNCSEAVPCTGIFLENIQLSLAISDQQLISNCNHAYGRTEGVVQPHSCLKS
ncbi:hypothetical protein NE237_027307 [Protea cynaroides]|uniref:Polygalacturonase n=1 Tax=Protea cynaroides TaxID=273540 RepID=A0A9Q0GN64_9MAGN|nr:hypothetical protein NE237_027307 [Protea cynaroides]